MNRYLMTILATVGILLGTAVGLIALPGLTYSADKSEEKTMVKEGQQAPDVELPATQIEKVLPDKKNAKTLSLKDFQGKKHVVLFFYPRAMTPGCTVESCGFRDIVNKFAELDTVVIGASTDKLTSQQKFTDKEKLNFPLLADSEKKLAKAYGVLGATGSAQRKTFVIDKQGKIVKIYSKVGPAKHPEEVLAFVKEKLAEKK